MSTSCSVNALNPDAAGQGGAGSDWGLGSGCQDMGRYVDVEGKESRLHLSQGLSPRDGQLKGRGLDPRVYRPSWPLYRSRPHGDGGTSSSSLPLPSTHFPLWTGGPEPRWNSQSTPYPVFYSTPGIGPGGGRGRWHHPRCVDGSVARRCPGRARLTQPAPTRVCTGGRRSAEGAACQPLPLLPVLAPAPAHGRPR